MGRHSVDHTTGSQLGSLQLVPQTTVSPSSLVPHTIVSPSLAPITTSEPETAHAIWQSSPPHLRPHTTFCPLSLTPGPHAIASPPSRAAAPQVVHQAFASGASWPPWIRRLPQTICELQPVVDGYSASTSEDDMA